MKRLTIKLRAFALAAVMLGLCTTMLRPVHALATVNVKTQCGAVGDGVTNDSAAFRQAALMLEAAGGGTLEIPQGTYIVGQQSHIPGSTPYYIPAEIFNVQNLSSLTVNGHNSTIKMASGLRWGSFDPATGAIYDPPTNPFTDLNYKNSVGNILEIASCSNVSINDLTINGNSMGCIRGGAWGTSGVEIFGGYGIHMMSCTDVTLTNVDSIYNCLDGFCIKWPGLTATHAPTPHTLVNCKALYNGRNNFTWVGGIGVSATNCEFSHSQSVMSSNGRLVFSSPGAGLDIEGENSMCRNGYFSNCRFEDNGGAGMTVASGDGGYTTFENCIFWGTRNYSVIAKRPGLKFTDCQIYGTVLSAFGDADPAKATGFLRCTFEDKPYTGSQNSGMIYREGYLLKTDLSGLNVSFDTCNFTANAVLSLWYNSPVPGGSFTNCNITHKWAGQTNGGFQSLIRRATLSGCRFLESFPAGTSNTWYIALNTTAIATGPVTVVDGPLVRWRRTTGVIGTIPPGTYTS